MLTLSCSAPSQDMKRDARSVLSRTGLLTELQSKGILNLVPAEVKQIHALLEADFNPLELCRKLVRDWVLLCGSQAQDHVWEHSTPASQLRVISPASSTLLQPRASSIPLQAKAERSA